MQDLQMLKMCLLYNYEMPLLATAAPQYGFEFVHTPLADWPATVERLWSEGADVIAFFYMGAEVALQALRTACVQAYYDNRNCVVMQQTDAIRSGSVAAIPAMYGITYHIRAFVRESPHRDHLLRFVGPFAEAEFVQGALAYRGLLLDDARAATYDAGDMGTSLARFVDFQNVNEHRATHGGLPPLISATSLCDVANCSVGRTRESVPIEPLLERVMAAKVLSETTAWAYHHYSVLKDDVQSDALSGIIQETVFNVLQPAPARAASAHQLAPEACRRAFELADARMSPFSPSPVVFPIEWPQIAYEDCANAYIAAGDWASLVALRATTNVYSNSFPVHVEERVKTAMRTHMRASHSAHAQMPLTFCIQVGWHEQTPIARTYARIADMLDVQGGFPVARTHAPCGHVALLGDIDRLPPDELATLPETFAILLTDDAQWNTRNARHLALLRRACMLIVFSEAQRLDVIAKLGRHVEVAKIRVLPLFADRDAVNFNAWQLRSRDYAMYPDQNVVFAPGTDLTVMRALAAQFPSMRFCHDFDTAHLYVSAQLNERAPWLPLDLIDSQVRGVPVVTVATGAIAEYTKSGFFYKAPSTARATVEALVTRAVETLKQAPATNIERMRIPYELLISHAHFAWNAAMHDLFAMR